VDLLGNTRATDRLAALADQDHIGAQGVASMGNATLAAERIPWWFIGDSQVVPIALNIDGLEFDTPNAYSVVITVDSEEMRRLPLRVRTLVQIPGFGPTQLPTR
jgi:hypothetical protein